MVGSFVSVQRHKGEQPWFMVLCEVVVIGKRLNYGKKATTDGEKTKVWQENNDCHKEETKVWQENNDCHREETEI